MSIFDKFRGNPYVSTYAGAPVTEFNQVATNLQAKYDKNLADMDQLQLQLDAVETLDIDKGQKEEIGKYYRDQIEQLSQAPEMASRGVRRLAGKFAVDPKLKLLKENKAKVAELTKQIDENDYSEFQTRKFYEALEEYNREGGAASGRKFTGFKEGERYKDYYEEQNIGELVDERVEGIKAFKTGEASIDPVTKQIVSTTSDDISLERVAQSAIGVLADEKVRRQVYDEYINSTPASEIPEDPTEQEAALRNYFFNKYIGGDLGGAVAKYVKKDDVSKLTRAKAAASRATSGGDTRATVSAAPSVVLDVFNQEVLDREEEKSPQQIMTRLNELSVVMEEGEFAGRDPSAVYNEYTFLRNSLKDALTSSEQGLQIIDDPNLRDIIAKIDSDELWEITQTTGILPEIQSGLMEIAQGSGDFPYTEFNSLLTKYEQRNGRGASMPFKQAISSANKRAQNEREVIKARGGSMTLPEFEQLQQQYIRENLANTLQSPEIMGSSFDRIDTPKLQQLLKNQNLTDQQVLEYTRDIKSALNDTWWTRSYQDSMRRGLKSVQQQREVIAANKIMTDEEIADVNNSLESIFADVTDPKAINLEAISVIENGKLRPADMDDFDGFNPQAMELTNLEVGTGVGAIQVKIPSIEGDNFKLLDIQLNPNTAYADIPNTITQSARARQALSLDADLQTQAKQVALAYSATEYLQRGQTAFVHNKDKFGEDREMIEEPLISNVLGEVFPMQNSDGEYYFETQSGTVLHNRTFRNANMALLYLFDKANER